MSRRVRGGTECAIVMNKVSLERYIELAGTSVFCGSGVSGTVFSGGHVCEKNAANGKDLTAELWIWKRL